MIGYLVNVVLGTPPDSPRKPGSVDPRQITLYVKYNDIVASGVQNGGVMLFDLPKPSVSIGFQTKKQYAKSMKGMKKVMKLVTTSTRCLRSLITTLQFWTPEATISLYFMQNEPSQSRLKGGIFKRFERKA